MEFGFLITILFIFIIFSIVMSVFAMAGISPGMIIQLVAMSQRRRTEMAPRDHYDRWVAAQRRAAYINKPRRLRYLSTSGDRLVPPHIIGKIKGCTPWMAYYVVFVKTRRWSWSDPFIIPQDMASDLNRRTLWVAARGFTKVGPIHFPVPNETNYDIDKHVVDCLDAFRFSFEQQLHTDIQENAAWSIEHGMSPPISDSVKVAEADSPGYAEKEYIAEDPATGGGFA